MSVEYESFYIDDLKFKEMIKQVSEEIGQHKELIEEEVKKTAVNFEPEISN